jgi:hypothetical protein
LGQDGATIISALKKKKPSWSAFTDSTDESELISVDHGARTKHLVNILSYNRNDRDIDYGEIFGDDMDTPYALLLHYWSFFSRLIIVTGSSMWIVYSTAKVVSFSDFSASVLP